MLGTNSHLTKKENLFKYILGYQKEKFNIVATSTDQMHSGILKLTKTDKSYRVWWLMHTKRKTTIKCMVYVQLQKQKTEVLYMLWHSKYKV